jgi:hypothetical protein
LGQLQWGQSLKRGVRVFRQAGGEGLAVTL